MDAPGVSLRPKRLRRDVSPTKLSPNLEKSPNKGEPNCSTAEDKSSSQDKQVPVASSPAGVSVKRNLGPKKWTFPEKMVFFEGVRQHGRCFLKISKLFEQKSKNKPEIQLRDTGQCRYFFTRSIKRLCLFPQINLDSGVRKKYMEILALVNYGEILRKTERDINKRTAENLNEMIYKGSTVMKMPGRVVRVKTPLCPVVKRFMKKKEMCSFIHLPHVVTMEFSPRLCVDYSVLRSATMNNPYTRVTVPITKSFAATLRLIENRVRNYTFQSFKHLAGPSELVEPKLIFNLNAQSVSQVNYVQETDKVYTPSSFNGVEEMLAHGIGLTKEVTENAANSAKAGQGINLTVQLGGETTVYASSSCSPGGVSYDQTSKTLKQTEGFSNPKNEIREEIVYIANTKVSSTKQFVRHPFFDENADDFYSYLRECFCLDSMPPDLTIAKLLVIMNVPPIVQIEYAINIDPLELSTSHKLNPDIDSIINIGLMVSQSKRSQTPVMGLSNMPHDQECNNVNSDFVVSQTKKHNADGAPLGRAGSTGNCPVPGSTEERQLKDHIMMLQSTGKVRLRNRLKFQDLSHMSSGQIDGNFTNSSVVNETLNDLSNNNPIQRRLPKIAPKLFNQITGSITLRPNNSVGKIILGNHTNGQRISTIADKGALSTCNRTSNFIRIPFKHSSTLQPIQLSHNQLETTYANPVQHESVAPIEAFPHHFVNPLHDNQCLPDILDVAMKTAKVTQGDLQAANSANSAQVSTVLPPLSEILPPTNEMGSSVGNISTPSMLTQDQCSPLISGSSLPISQVRLLPGCLSSAQTFDASSDSFLSRRLDGEIEEMLNDDSVDVANKFDALLNSTESVLT